MLMLAAPVIRQRLFCAKMPDGTTLYLAFLLDDRCALMRDSEIVEVWDQPDCLEQGLERFLELSKAQPANGR
jgi:hypothetical protein